MIKHSTIVRRTALTTAASAACLLFGFGGLVGCSSESDGETPDVPSAATDAASDAASDAAEAAEAASPAGG